MSKRVIITGGSSGIGLGIARVLAGAGHHLLINGLEANGKEIADALAKEFGVKVVFHPANMLKPEEIRAMVDFAGKELGGVDVLINNAGIQFVSPVEDFPDEKWEAIMGINLNAAFYASKAVWKGMKENKWGRIINVASAHGLVASEFKSAYVAAKHGVVGLTKVLALEGAPFGITANAICPGYVKTPLVEKQIADQAKAHGLSEEEVIQKVMLVKHSVKDFVTVEQLGQLALFLISDHARLMTGTALPVDGGWNAQ